VKSVVQRQKQYNAYNVVRKSSSLAHTAISAAKSFVLKLKQKHITLTLTIGYSVAMAHALVLLTNRGYARYVVNHILLKRRK